MSSNEFQTIEMCLVRSNTGRLYIVEREIAVALHGSAGWDILDPSALDGDGA